ncbi:MAG: LamG domain-containing protein [Chloroflexi bacterium]|nr:LamG domain-containing protein [Chloroflexota bacterium]
MLIATGTPTRTPTPTPTSTTMPMPPFGGRLILDGADDYAETPDDPELDIGDEPGESLTVEVWVKFRTFSFVQIVAKSDAYMLFTGLDEFDRISSCLRFEISYAWVSFCSTGSPLAPGRWYHIAGVYDKVAGEVNLYADGQRLVGPLHPERAIDNSPNNLKVGVKLAGEIDEVRVSSAARYTGPSYAVPTFPFTCDAQTRALWHFDEVEGATLFHDACGAIDNLLTGYNGAHTEGVQAHRLYLPLIVKGY